MSDRFWIFAGLVALALFAGAVSLFAIWPVGWRNTLQAGLLVPVAVLLVLWWESR